jgi:hypothetical protein
MRIRNIKAAALASSAIAIGAVLLAGTAPAFANQTDMLYITNLSNSRYYLVDVDGYADVSQPINGGNDFSNINGTTWSYDGGSRPVYEWTFDDPSGDGSSCLTADGSSHLEILPCKAGEHDQLWWQNSAGQFINWGATGTGSDQCMNAEHAEDGGNLNVIGCKSKSQSGWFDQYWTSEG